jgi:predicted Rossmann fold flavoprotein
VSVQRGSYDLIVVGAGAAGLAAAVAFARRCSGSALLIEANDEPGRKLLATGNGRCNLSNAGAPGWERTKEFFDSLGILLRADEAGRAYPLSRRADTVRDALVCECGRLGCEFSLRTRVTVIRPGDDDDFVVEAERREPDTEPGAKKGARAAEAERLSLRATQVIVATGGKARPEYGNLGDGYAFARALGVAVTPIRPVLVPFVYADEVRDELAALAGVRAAATVRLLAGGTARPEDPGSRLDAEAAEAGEVVAEASGEVQFTEYGLSGICVFDLSRYYRGQERGVSIDFAPGLAREDIAALIAADRAAGLAGIVHPKVAALIERRARAAATYAEEAAALIKGFFASVKGTKGWKDAQITGGGVAMTGVSEKYFESKDAPGLYFVGEVLDADGPSGGYNLDHAWNTGLKAGRAAGAYCASLVSSPGGAP